MGCLVSDSGVEMLLARVRGWQEYRTRYQTPEMYDLIALAGEYERLRAERDALKAAAEKSAEYVLAQINQDLRAERDAAVKALHDIARQPEGDEQSAQAVAREAFKIIDAARGGA